MAWRDTIRTILGILGNATSLFLFLSPLKKVFGVCRSKSTEESSSWVPYLATIANCLLWVFYGAPPVHPQSYLVMIINAVGVALQLIYFLVFIIYSVPNKRRNMLKALGAVVVSFVVLVVVTLTEYHSAERRSSFVGVIAAFTCIGMYAAPVFEMKKVIETGSVEHMTLPLSIAGLVNAFVWTVYALMGFDLYVFVPNVLGFLLGMGQVYVYQKYNRTITIDD
ncbi:hypothetical protein SUGI_0769590 [Cryptomeria japonica]|uniref:bidirectional sugar transporter SWEET4-like n=1 Tax=Cryptomeria japonica TaxID=3369 RepID=UPI0024149A08|nr:bidirectional sugar transporter SWEET4-like [Cryptomeria japonica]GLJ37833.1 hypothetical protein SUGI_0769590 [Cryptomeria japonica]